MGIDVDLNGMYRILDVLTQFMIIRVPTLAGHYIREGRTEKVGGVARGGSL